jgi:hypothetical protein
MSKKSALPHYWAMTVPPWNEDDFQRRAAARLAELDKSQRGALREVPGATPDTIRKGGGKQGRTVQNLIRIANALDWTMAEVFGESPPAARVDQRLLGFALHVAQNRVPRGLLGSELFNNVVVLAYDYLDGLARTGVTIKDGSDALRQTDALVNYEIGRRRRTAENRDGG